MPSPHAGACRAEAAPGGQPSWVSHLSLPPAECSVTGDIHFTTFDGRRYTFPATCQYILAKSRSSGTFTVTLQNAPCGLVRAGDPRSNPASQPCYLPPRKAWGFRAGLQVFPQITHSALSSFWAEPGAGGWVPALEHSLRVISLSWASVL